MQTYNTIPVATQSDPWGPKFWGVNGSVQYGPYSPADLPVGTTRSFIPSSSIVTRVSPKTSGSWKKIKESGAIVMHPHEVSRVDTVNHLVPVNRGSAMLYYPASYNTTAGICYGSEKVVLPTEWTEQGDFAYWSTTCDETFLNSVDGLVGDAVSRVKAGAVSDFMSGYDLLTELSELRENFHLIQSLNESASGVFSKFFSENNGSDIRRAVQSKKSAQQLLRSADKGLRRVGSAWMAYRYIIMPLVYSYRDISELIDENGLLFKSFRSKEKITMENSSIPEFSDSRIVTYTTGTIDVRCTIKAGYTKEGLQSLVTRGVDFNLFVTAWELIPLSFVVDWFINIGDYISANTGLDFSAQSMGCIAVKRNLKTTSLLHTPQFPDQKAGFFGSTSNRCYSGWQYVTYSPPGNPNLAVLREITEDSYVREVFKPVGIDLQLNNNPMNWKRWLDASVISYSTLRSILIRISRK